MSAEDQHNRRVDDNGFLSINKAHSVIRKENESLIFDLDNVEFLVKDLMCMAQSCSFKNDIHPLVDSIADCCPSYITEEELLVINPRYGDIVYNMMNLRENYQRPVSDFVSDSDLQYMLAYNAKYSIASNSELTHNSSYIAEGLSQLTYPTSFPTYTALNQDFRLPEDSLEIMSQYHPLSELDQFTPPSSSHVAPGVPHFQNTHPDAHLLYDATQESQANALKMVHHHSMHSRSYTGHDCSFMTSPQNQYQSKESYSLNPLMYVTPSGTCMNSKLPLSKTGTMTNSVPAILEGTVQQENSPIRGLASSYRPKLKSSHSQHTGIKLWQFLLKLLVAGKNTGIIRWISRIDGTFRVINSDGLAKLWGNHKNRPYMNYDKMSRAMRYYYHKQLLDKAPKRLCYQFKYYSKWWIQLQNSDPNFKMPTIPLPPPGSPPLLEDIEL